MMNRREFAKHLALLAAGAAALPAQLSAFERLYDINTKPLGDTDLVSIEDIALGFSEPGDYAHFINIYNDQSVLYSFALNQRATFRYLPAPTAPMLATHRGVRWTTESYPAQSRIPIMGTIRYIDQSGMIRTCLIDKADGRLT